MDQNALHFLTFATIGWLYLQGSIIRIYPTTLTTANPLCTPRNLVTGSKIRVIGGGFLESFTFYDDRYRVVKTIEENHLGGKETISTEYYNAVSPLVSKTTRDHSGPTAKEIIEEYTYDHLDRVKTIKTTIGSDISTITNTYNEIGELITKDLSGAQTVDYRYNIRGWLTTINGGTSFSGNDRFGMELKYNNAPNAQYNGNIGQMLWRTTGGGLNAGEQEFQYDYDDLNRILSATYNSDGTTYDNHFNVSGISYDPNGNILGLTRKLDGADADILDYDYLHGNQLSSVDDASTSALFEDGASEDHEYVYDANGNMIRDLNKEIININYNYLNLPELVKFSDNIEVEYTYDASGRKLSMTVDDGSPETTHYVNGIHYTNTTIKFVQVPEGRYLFGISEYEYHLTDHLGNVRATVDKDGIVQQRDDYYPFGLTFNSNTPSTPNLYKYNGKEEQEETDWLDFGARMYDPLLGRFNSVDQLADSSWSFAPYHYTANNPILFVDPDGRDFLIWYKDKDGVQVSFRFNGTNGGDAPKNEFVQNFLTAYNYNAENGGGDKLQAIAGNGKISVKVAETDEGSLHYAGVLYFNPERGAEYENGTVVSPATVLEHEADHAYEYKTNPSGYGGKGEELRAIRNEQKTARANSEISATGVTRTRHEGKGVITYGVTSNKVNRAATTAYRKEMLERARKAQSFDVEAEN